MEMNAEKTEYLIVGQQGGALITSTGARIEPTTTANYLGYKRHTNDSTIQHLKERISKASKASFSVGTILKRLPKLPIKR